MESIKNSWAIKFLMSKDIKTKYIKLAIVLGLMFLTFFNEEFSFIVFAFCASYIAFEFSADSIFWITLIGICVRYISSFLLQILMWELIIILLYQLVRDIVNKNIQWKNWRFITLVGLFGALVLLLMLPLATTYSFGAQLNRFAMFGVLFLGIFYIKQINIKHLLTLFAISVATLCIGFSIANALGGGNGVVITQNYSKGVVERFSAFNIDPNFTGAILICAITSWFFVYKKKFINKYLYFAGLLIFAIFTLMTISKSTILIIALFGAYVVVENIIVTIKTKNVKHLIELVYYLVILLIACAICWKYVDAMYQRIFNPRAGWWTDEDSNTMSNLTTGRSELWMGYLKAIFSDWRIFLFGSGVKSWFGYIGTSAHSMPIEYLYKYGIIVVMILLAIFVIGALPYVKKTKPYNFVPLILITGIFCSIGSVSSKYVYVFVITFLTLCFNGLEKSQDIVITHEKDIITKNDNKINN